MVYVIMSLCSVHNMPIKWQKYLQKYKSAYKMTQDTYTRAEIDYKLT